MIIVKQDETELLRYFEKLEGVLFELDQVVEWLHSEDQMMTDEFKDDGDNKYFRSPFYAFDGYQFEQMITEVKQNCCYFVVKEMNKFYKNIILDHDEIWNRFQETGFFPTAVHSYIHNMCMDEDKVALEQIKTLCIELLPFGDYELNGGHGKANKPEHIMHNKNSMQLHENVSYSNMYHGTKRIRALVNFIWITLENASPADVEPQTDILNKTGIVIYQDDIIKSIRVYKNSNVKVMFYDPAHTGIVCKALTDLVEVKDAID